MPKISVIMGVYNCKDFGLLKKSIQSIIDQTFQDWEFLICDDGSTNGTLKELQNIAQSDSRIRVLSYSKNKGLANALNVCLQEARGEFIARQDDDDISLPLRFERQLEVFEKHPEYSLVGTIADVYDENGVWGEYRLDEKPDKKSFLWNNPFLHPTVMARAEVMKKINGYKVTKATRRCEDYEIYMRMYALGYYGYNIQEKLYLYRIVVGTQKYRPMKYRIDEAIIRYQGYKEMKILLKGFPYIFKPIIIGLIPQGIFKKIRRKQYQ